MSDHSTQLQAAPKPIWYRDVRVLRVLAQIVFAIVVLAAGSYLYTNFTRASANAGLPTGYSYLDGPTNFVIPDSPFRASQRVLEALRVGIRNTLAAAAVGWVLTTILGVLIGVGRLSTNWLVRKASQVYVETLRNIPPLVVIIIIFTPILGKLPQIQEPAEAEGLFVLSNRGLWVPWFNADGPGAGTYWWVVLAAAIAAALVGRWRTRLNERTGAPHHRIMWGAGVGLAVLAIGYVVLGAPFGIDGPTREARSVTGGIKMSIAYAAVTFGLTLYTASHVAEIVRGSIQAVPNGQSEAANALALSAFQRMRFIVLPQAFRIMIPPLASQYLNFTKNTSLAVFIGYAEITQVSFTVQGNGNPGVQTFLLLMAVYLTISLAISFGANAVNYRMQEGAFPWWAPMVPMVYVTLAWFYMGPLAGQSGGAWQLAMIASVVILGGLSLYRLAIGKKWIGRPSALAATTITGA